MVQRVGAVQLHLEALLSVVVVQLCTQFRKFFVILASFSQLS